MLKKGKIICWITIFVFFGIESAKLKLGSFYNLTDKPVELTISRIQESKTIPKNSNLAVKLTIAKESSIKLDKFAFETQDGPNSGFIIVYNFINQKKASKSQNPENNKIIIKYKYLVSDEKNCSKSGICPLGYMAQVNLGKKLYKNVYCPISQKGSAVLDISITQSGTQSGIKLGGTAQILDPEYNFIISDAKIVNSKKLLVSLF